MRTLQILTASTLLCLSSAARVEAWGATAHRVISRVAVNSLPADVPAFVKRQIDWIGVRSITPDSWRSASEPFVKIVEDPNHGWFMEQFAFMTTIPRSRYEFVLALYDEYKRIERTDPARAALTNVRWTGTLPYAAVETYERLKVAFRAWREEQRQKQDTTFIELDAAFYIGWLSHYIADGAMPLHTSIHHDGWQGDDPKGYTRDGSIHSRFEAAYVDRIGLVESDIQSRVPTANRIADPFTAILAHLARSHTRVDQVYALDQANAYNDATSSEARALIYTCTGEAATMLRDLVFTAWLESGEQPVSAAGTLQPTDLRHPQYNPATGSAPAPLPAPR